MPWAVFFADGGIAFHGGDTRSASAGCIRVPKGDDQAFFNYLQMGDQVQVVRAKEEQVVRTPAAASTRGTARDGEDHEISSKSSGPDDGGVDDDH